MNIEEVRKLSDEALKTKLLDAKKEYMELRFQHISSQLTNTSDLKRARRDIAKIETIIREREIEAAQEGEK